MRLFNGKVIIDEFKSRLCVETDVIYILTHWHSDHFKGISNQLKCRVFCTYETYVLMSSLYPDINATIVEYNSFIPGIEYQIFILDANHMPGSMMLYFSDLKLLFTSDYRLNEKMINCLKKEHIKDNTETLVVDGTFHHPNIKFISDFEGCTLFKSIVNDMFNIQTHDVIAVGAYHIGTCHIFDLMQIRFQLHSSLSDNLRRQIMLIYPHLISDDSIYTIVNPSKFKNNNRAIVIIPSALWYCCDENTKHVRYAYVDKDRIRINFSRHSDYHENMQLYRLLKPINFSMNGQTRHMLKC